MDRPSQSRPGTAGASRRSLYPQIEPFESDWMATGGPHEIYYEQCGARSGKPALVLHGGPGGAINPTMRRFFNPRLWRVVLFDQRGCGRSRPNASLEDNTTWTLIQDIEQLREKLGIEKWTVFGGSWGSTLALAYAVTYPERVEALVLRGIFLLTQKEVDWFYKEGASMLFPDAWAGFVGPIPRAERSDLVGAYHRRLTHPDRRIQSEAAAAWSQWEGDTISLKGPEGRPAKFNESDFAIAFARIECHYFINKGFFPEDGWLLKQASRLKGIKGWIVQGRFDVVTPLDAAWKLKSAWPDASLEIVWDAGHASTEPGIIDGLVRATDEAAKLG